MKTLVHFQPTTSRARWTSFTIELDTTDEELLDKFAQVVTDALGRAVKEFSPISVYFITKEQVTMRPDLNQPEIPEFDD